MTTEIQRRCLGCEYPLDHLPEPRCPECGREFDPCDPLSFAGIASGQRERRTTQRILVLSLVGAALMFAFGQGPILLRPSNALDWLLPALFMQATGLFTELLALGLALTHRPHEDRLMRVWFATLAIALLSLIGCFSLPNWSIEAIKNF